MNLKTTLSGSFQRVCRPLQPPGFTLIELLVVIAIMTVLMSLLLPSLESARKRAQQVACVHLHRQLGMAAALYTQDNNGFYPDVYRRTFPGSNWELKYWGPRMVQEGYLGSEKAIYCPLVPRDWQSPPHALGMRIDDLDYYPLRLHRKVHLNMPDPSSFALIADSFTTKRDPDPIYLRYNFFFYTRHETGVPSEPRTHRIHLRHAQQANILFADGSARSLGTNDIIALDNGLGPGYLGFGYED